MTINEAITRSKAEILIDVASGIVPETCASFSELHDYVDANGYGGAFENTPLCADDDSNIAECHANVDFWNTVQASVDQWIKSGGLKQHTGGKMTLINLKGRVAVSHSVPTYNKDYPTRRITMVEAFYGEIVQETETFEQWRILRVANGSYFNEGGCSCALQYEQDMAMNVVVDIRKDYIIASQGVK